MGLIKSIRSRLSMKKAHHSFWDNIDRKPVYLWCDKYGVYWLAHCKWGIRIKSCLNDFKYK